MTFTFPRCLWEVVLPLLEDLNTPRSLSVKLLIEHGEFDQLVNLKTDPAHYQDADSYFRDCVATDLLRKNADLRTSIDREEVAVAGFHAAEKQCARTNLRFSVFLQNGPFEDTAEIRCADILHSVKRRIRKILGVLPPDVFLDGRFGPGATFNDRACPTVPHKISSSPTLTDSLSHSCFFGDWLTTMWKSSVDEVVDGHVSVVRGNRFTSVPRDATKNRGIAIEPSINVFYQLALGKAIRRRLNRCGIDLDEGQSIHRAEAQRASLTGSAATIDLSSASDTVCKNLVEFLLPDDWFWALNTLRSPTTLLNGRTYCLEKFSSMGNGFTFELETLIFLSLAIEACHLDGVRPIPGTNVFVYGDDIIVPSECSSTLLALLRYCGFTPNKSKTYVDGPFRESCGGDFFLGEPVRAHFLKEYPNEPPQWISLANGLRRMSDCYSHSTGLSDPFRRAWFSALNRIPMPFRECRGPTTLGDVVIHDDPAFWTTRFKYSIQQFRCVVATSSPIPLERWGCGTTQLAAALLGCSSRGPIQRGSPVGFSVKWVPDVRVTHRSHSSS